MNRFFRCQNVISCIFCVSISVIGQAKEVSQPEGEQAEDSQVVAVNDADQGKDDSLSPSFSMLSRFRLMHDEERPRDSFWPPLISFVLPGFDQWLEGQYSSAAIYTGTALGGLFYANYHAQHITEEEVALGPDVLDNDQRGVALGSQIYQVAGGISAYHSFRSSVRSWQPHGRFTFLQEEEQVSDLLLAPLNFSYLTRPTTYLPLGILAGLAGIGIAALEPNERRNLTGGDIFYASAFSFNAGTHEEMVFRGWLYPLFYEQFKSPFLANGLQSLIFAAAHLSTVSVPIPQLLLGWYLGYLTRKDRWTLGESIFIHTWWDVIVFTTTYMLVAENEGEEAARSIPFMLTLPVLSTTF